MTKNISFKTTPLGVDTGTALSASISPVSNGESMTQTTLRRPSEALRQRTEVLRIEANENRWLRDNDRALFTHLVASSGTPSISWAGTVAEGGSGALALGASTSLIIVPSTSPGAPKSTWYEGSGLRFPTRYYHLDAYQTSGSPNFIRLLASIFEFEGAADLTFEVIDDPGSVTVTVTVNGDATVADPSSQPGRRNIVVTFDSGAAHTLADIEAALTADVIASSLISVVSVSAPGTLAFEYAETAFEGGTDGVYHEITSAALASFVAALGVSKIPEGATLAIWYDTVQLRKQSIEENANKHLIPSASIVLLDDSSEFAANCVVVGRVIDNRFVLVDGSILAPGVALATTHDSVGLLRSQLLASYNAFPPGEPNFALGRYGSHMIGIEVDDMPFMSTISPTAFSLQQALTEIDSYVNHLYLSGARWLREDLNRGIAAPPLAQDMASVGADYVGVDASTFTFLDNTAQSQQQLNESIENEFLDAYKHTQDVASNAFLFPAEALEYDTLGVNAQRSIFNVARLPVSAAFDSYLQLVTDVGSSAAPVNACNGHYFVVDQSTGEQRLVNLGDGVRTPVAFTWTNIGTFGATGMDMDDTRVFAIGGDSGFSTFYVEGVLLATPATKWSTALPGAPYAVCAGPDYVYVAYNGGGAGCQIQAYNKSTGAAVGGVLVTWHATGGTLINDMKWVRSSLVVAGQVNTAGRGVEAYSYDLTVRDTIAYTTAVTGERIAGTLDTLFLQTDDGGGSNLRGYYYPAYAGVYDITLPMLGSGLEMLSSGKLVFAIRDEIFVHYPGGGSLYKFTVAHLESSTLTGGRVVMITADNVCTDGYYAYWSADTDGTRAYPLTHKLRKFAIRDSSTAASGQYLPRSLFKVVYPID